MAIDVNAIYRDGILQPLAPLDLPENASVHLIVEPMTERDRQAVAAGESRSAAISTAEFGRILRTGAFRAGTLPVDFDRDDIYSDHD